LFQSKTLNFIPLLGPYFSPQIGQICIIVVDSDSASPKILKFIYELFQSNTFNVTSHFGGPILTPTWGGLEK